MAAATIIVEGGDDLRFMLQYLHHLGFDASGFGAGEWKGVASVEGIAVCVCPKGGDGALIGDKAPTAQVVQIADASDKVLIVADADKDKVRRKTLAKTARKIKAETALFLLPDGKSDGELETLLLQIFIDNGGVGECFEQYEQCLRDKKLQLPNPKGKIYAYCEVHDSKKHKVPAGGAEREYSDGKFWNLNHQALNELRDFLKANLPPAK